MRILGLVNLLLRGFISVRREQKYSERQEIADRQREQRNVVRLEREALQKQLREQRERIRVAREIKRDLEQRQREVNRLQRKKQSERKRYPPAAREKLAKIQLLGFQAIQWADIYKLYNEGLLTAENNNIIISQKGKQLLSESE